MTANGVALGADHEEEPFGRVDGIGEIVKRHRRSRRLEPARYGPMGNGPTSVGRVPRSGPGLYSFRNLTRRTA